MADVVDALRRGKPVLLPADGVYGLCSSVDEDSVRRLYALKGRADAQPTAVIAASIDALLELVPELRGGSETIARARELASFVEKAAAEYKTPTETLIAVGYSNGANIAAAMLLLGVAPFRHAILLRAMPPLSNIDIPRLDGRTVLRRAGLVAARAQGDRRGHRDRGQQLGSHRSLHGSVMRVMCPPAARPRAPTRQRAERGRCLRPGR